MKKIFLSILFVWCLLLPLFGQINTTTANSISDCSGAIPISGSGDFNLQFTGTRGNMQDISRFSELTKLKATSSVYCLYTANSTGRLSLQVKSEAKFQMVIFQSDSTTICNEIQQGRAELIRVFKTVGNEFGLNLILGPNTLFPVNLKAGQQIIIGLYSDTKNTEHIFLKTTYESFNNEFIPESEKSKYLDLREDEFQPGLTVKLRDQETGNPVIANITILGIKSLTATYNGSDFKFPVERSGKIHIEVDAEGYFFVDRDEPITFNTENEIVIWLEPLGNGKSQKIDQVEFYPGSSEFLKTALPKLVRLKNFLALNSYVKIEIQGHVHSNNPINTVDGQRLSEARAKRIYNYLVDSGIDKSRMVTMGYGNTKPIYPKATLPSEEQANRRVEIKIL